MLLPSVGAHVSARGFLKWLQLLLSVSSMTNLLIDEVFLQSHLTLTAASEARMAIASLVGPGPTAFLV